jgi:hypothetical protein
MKDVVGKWAPWGCVYKYTGEGRFVSTGVGATG